VTSVDHVPSLPFEGLEVAAVVSDRPPWRHATHVQTCVHDFGVPLFTESSIVAVHAKDASPV